MNDRDLKEPINKTVAENQRIPSGDPMLIEVDGCLHLYHHENDLFLGERFSQRLRAEQDWFEKLIDHAPTVGTFYEDTLRALIDDVLPSRMKVGTGFIWDTATKKRSKQLDILVYDDSDEAPFYKRGQFVVVPPSLAIAQSEVKKTLKLQQLKEIIHSCVNSYFGDRFSEPLGCSHLNIFSYSSQTKTARIFDAVFDSLTVHAQNFHSKTKSGGKAVLAMRSIVLPQLYLFDRDSLVQSKLRARDDGKYDIIVSEVKASLKDGLNEFLSAMVLSRNQSDTELNRDFRTYPLHNVLREETIVPSIFLARHIPIIELLKYFPGEEHKIKGFRVRGQKPYMVVVPAGINLPVIGSFDELKDIPSVLWLT